MWRELQDGVEPALNSIRSPAGMPPSVREVCRLTVQLLRWQLLGVALQTDASSARASPPYPRGECVCHPRTGPPSGPPVTSIKVAAKWLEPDCCGLFLPEIHPARQSGRTVGAPRQWPSPKPNQTSKTIPSPASYRRPGQALLGSALTLCGLSHTDNWSPICLQARTVS